MLKKTENAIYALNKATNKRNKENLRLSILNAAYINNKMYITDGMCLGKYNELLPGCIVNPAITINFDFLFDKNIKDCNTKVEIPKDLIVQINQYIKTLSRKQYKKFYINFTEKAIFNYKFFKQFLPTFEHPRIFIRDTEYPAMYIIGDNGVGLLLGCVQHGFTEQDYKIDLSNFGIQIRGGNNEN